mmetsp:Transcript_32081/g.47862  ORF Transcript_32081/g.47862 Transcript_32081/m.47862 type:complete len:253 (-) Transcript_32081:520-1278(-)
MLSFKQIFCFIISCAPLSKAMAETITFSTVAQGHNSGIENAANEIIQSGPDFYELWGRHTSISSPPDGVPPVDFHTETVLAVFRGNKSSGGYGVEVKGVEDTGDEIVVSCETTDPSPDDMVTMALTQPFHIVRTPKTTKDVRFEFIKASAVVSIEASSEGTLFPKYIVTFEKGRKEEGGRNIESLDVVKDVTFLASGKIAIVDFDPTKIALSEAYDLLQGIEGVAIVEEDRPVGAMGGGMEGEMGFGMGFGI